MIYFIQAGKGRPIKIGFARVVSSRRIALQCAHYRQLTILAAFPGTKNHETILHNQFIKHHIRGEWYRPSLPIRTFIHRLKNPLWTVQFRGDQLFVGSLPKEKPIKKKRPAKKQPPRKGKGKGNRTSGHERRGGRKTKYPGGTRWYSVGLPVTTGNWLEARGDVVPAIIGALRHQYPDLPWPERKEDPPTPDPAEE